MNVLAAAASIGLGASGEGDGFGTIDQDDVLAVLATLQDAHPGHDDLFAEASARVQLARSAGSEQIEPGSVFAQSRRSLEVQLRYRSEMYDVFTDLAIDLALSGTSAPEPAEPAPAAA